MDNDKLAFVMIIIYVLGSLLLVVKYREKEAADSNLIFTNGAWNRERIK